MNFINHMLKKHLVPTIAILILAIGAVYYFASRAPAAAPSGGYVPGEELNPDCAPNDPDCFVLTQWTNSGDDIYNTNSGNVGIGTTTPSARLDIKTSNSLFSTNDFRIRNSGDVDIFKISNRAEVQIGQPPFGLAVLSLQGIAAQTGLDALLIKTVSGNLILSADDAGNVGIGVAPLAKLHVKGSTANDSAFAIKSDNSLSQPLFYVRNDKKLFFATDPSTWDSVSLADFSGGTGYIKTNSSGILINDAVYGNWQFYSQSTEGLKLLHGGVGQVLEILGNGNVGIGTASPSYKLDVSGGDINTDGVYRNGGIAGVGGSFTAGACTVTVTGGIVTDLAGVCP